jgi:Fe-coproporphyrin III synthase
MGVTGGHAILQLHPTRRCNLRCLHCYSQSGPYVSSMTELEVLQHLVVDAADLGFEVVGISGGEPLLYRDLVRLLATAKQAGLRTTVTSNGMLLTERRLAELIGLVDILAISLDGVPATHDEMRGDPRAFTMMDSHMDGVERSGIPFGFITTLTQHNVHEVEYVVQYAHDHRASLVQIHPLELEGAAVTNLPGSVPDVRESAFALLEGARLSAVYGVRVQVDIAHLADLEAQPELFLAEEPAAGTPLSSWLTPLVVETDGLVVPLTYGFPGEYALGNANDHRLADLATTWNSQPFLRVCRAVAEKLLLEGRPLFNWYEEVAQQARLESRAMVATR